MYLLDLSWTIGGKMTCGTFTRKGCCRAAGAVIHSFGLLSGLVLQVWILLLGGL